jgi:hypothetical protein
MALIGESKNRRSTLLHLAIELFFAVLPLFVLSSVWPDGSQQHPESFISSPEVSMTSCILYGLALARLQLGSIVPNRGNGRERALGITVLSMLPLGGVITSVILITKLAHGTDSVILVGFQFLNLLLAILLFLIIGGYGVSRSSQAK